MQNRRSIASYTSGSKFVHVDVVDGTALEFTVRSPTDLGGLTSVCSIPVEDSEQFVRECLSAILDYISEDDGIIDVTLDSIIEIEGPR